ncbi:uncharacterized protein LOC110983337 isoform X2 [Acanthaster planci]|uniref:Uncharacterized protein LOC110983337 isoform X2 n=1 Tax=Acanthaster planci TaxID=133434 RepID=A0A8B7Z4E4_ACAPL|nr:uncharacterized protein LOC110983337 isoform X2 [Acanthaster planci]
MLAKISADDKWAKSVVAQCLVENNVIVCTCKEGSVKDERLMISEMVNRLTKVSKMIQGLPPSLKALPVELIITFNTSALLLQQMYQIEAVQTSLSQTGQATHPVSVSWSQIQEIATATLQRVPSDVISLVSLHCCVLSLGHMINKQYQNALSLLHEALKIQPRQSQDDRQRTPSQCLMMSLQVGNAVVDISQIQRNSSTLSVGDLAQFLLVTGLFQTGQWNDCLHHISTKEPRLPSSLDSTQKLIQGYSLFQTGNFKSALEHLAPLAESPDFDVTLKVKTINLIGCCLANLKKPYTAIQKFQEALKMDFSYLCPLYNITLVYQHLGLQDAEMEALDLLIKILRDKDTKATHPSACDVILGSQALSTATADEQSGIYSMDEQSLSVVVILYRLARRYLGLDRHSDAVNRYQELLSFIENDSSSLIKLPQVHQEDSISLPSLHTIYLETALSLYNANDIKQSLKITDRIITKMGPKVGHKTRTSDSASGSGAGEDAGRQHGQPRMSDDVFPGPSFRGNSSGVEELDVVVAVPSCSGVGPGKSARRTSIDSCLKLASKISYKVPSLKILTLARRRRPGERENSQESAERLLIANALLLKSNCLILSKELAQALDITNELLVYLSDVASTEDQTDEIGSCSRGIEINMESGSDGEQPVSKKRKIESTHENKETTFAPTRTPKETRKPQPIMEGLLEMKAKAYSNKAMILIGQKKHSEALHMLVLGTQCCPDDSDVMYNYTLLLTKLGRLEEARKVMSKLLVLEASLEMSPLSQCLLKHD